jgi:eukaryotic-like serine/threonine-protein kinase
LVKAHLTDRNMKLIKQLGEGGFGVVDLVVDDKDEKFARKTLSISQNLSADMVENVRKRFVREAKVQQGSPAKAGDPVFQRCQ